MLYVLICAGEGDTKQLYVAEQSLAHLSQLIADTLQHAIDDLPPHDINKDYNISERQALLAMLAQTPDVPGRHRVRPIDPLYEQWTLWITETPAASLDY